MTRTFLVADLFCGAGGTSTGAARAIRDLGGLMELVAVNHWDQAIATHTRNHPTARHYCVGLETVRPSALVTEGRLDLLMASPECVHHSRARGGRPVSDQRRADAWLVNRWLTDLDVSAILIENVPEFVEWGPIDPRTRKPIPEKKGLFFQAWVKSLWEMDYRVEWKFLNAADFGDATTRKRLFLIARKDGRPVRWPAATHAKTPAADMFGRVERWRPAREVIDWSRPGGSLLSRPRPLSVKTRLRIARGLLRFGGALGPAYVRLLDLPHEELHHLGAALDGPTRAFLCYQRDSTDADGRPVPSRPRSTDEPVPTVTTVARIGLIEPVVDPFVFANRTNNVATGTDGPIPTATTAPGGGIKLVQPVLIGQHGGGEARGPDDPLPTITTDGVLRLVSPHLAPYYSRTAPADVDEPLSTITAKARHGLVDPVAVPYGPKAEARSVDEPLPTVMTRDRLGVATPTAEPFVVPRTGHADPGGRVRSVADPLYTITASRSGTCALVEPFLTANFGERDGQGPRAMAVTAPLPSVTGRGAGNLIEPVAESFVLPRQSYPQPRSTDDPVPTATASGVGHLVEPVVVQVDHTGGNGHYTRPVSDPLPTIIGRQHIAVAEPALEPTPDGLAGVDPRRLVEIDGHLFKLDIRYRMLTNAELARAMSFDDDGAYDFVGKKSDVTQQIGNAVACRTAKALVLAILGPSDP